jgi:xanthine dehydrogenase accessory factor
MDDIFEQVRTWLEADHAVAIATVVETWGSSPRAVGARMAVRDDGMMAGSVSGGCVEGVVVEEALTVLGGAPAHLLHYGVTDETAWDVGLACGGSIEIFVQRLDPALSKSIEAGYTERRAICEAIVIAGPEDIIGTSVVFDAGGVVAGDWSANLLDKFGTLIAEALADGSTRREQVEIEGEPIELFIDVLLPPPTLIMIGAVHISIALSNLAKELGYRTIVIDPRKSFAAPERFPEVDLIVQRWPAEGLDEVGIDANTAIAVLTHDPKIDDPALLTALRSPAFYVGALGSRTTHAKRVERLRNEGFKSEELDRLKAPIGLDLGGRTPEEIAISILAEITATRYGKLSTKA